MNYCQQKYVNESNRHNAKLDTEELFDSIYMKFTNKQNLSIVMEVRVMMKREQNRGLYAPRNILYFDLVCDYKFTYV